MVVMDGKDIPQIDFHRFLHGNVDEQMEVAKEIGDACENVGFFYLSNHGIEEERFDRVYQQAKIYFAQPLEKKMELFIGTSSNGINRGYTPFFEEKLSPQGDLKEAFDLALELDENDPDRIHRHASLYGPNRWPKHLPNFRQIVYHEFYLKMVELGTHLLEAFALSLRLKRDYFVKMFEKPMITMRLIHYPPQMKIENEDQLGCGAHTDYECFTLLSQTNQSALQILNKNNEWINAHPIRGTFVVNIGDLMQRWTNDRFRSTIHRVINRTGEERYSIPIFFGPNYFTEIRPLTDDHPETMKKYPPILAGEYLQQRFNETYRYREQFSTKH